ncbi:MAG: translation initiation factor IF-2 subunit beta [DPANN group archaeon]|nr:translation initiation factor IF-2 subunit beta [DPANN group archaeon]
MTSSYAELLDSLYANLPDKVKSSERFEPPEFESFIQGNQTMIRNFEDVALKLRRDPLHLMKYLSKEFATSGDLDQKRGLLKGKHRPDALNSRLKRYIDEYVICAECKKPDTDLVAFGGVKHKRCEVCGARAPVKAI